MKKTNKNLTEWHPYFAWYPMSFDNRETGETVKVWWEWIGRKRVMGNSWPYWIYDPYFIENKKMAMIDAAKEGK